MAQYRNSFHDSMSHDSKEFITTEASPIEYKDHLIYERIKSVCFDVVKDGVCIGMYAGINGAKGFIDKIA
ncbi:hypothetical protein [Sphingobacterium sp. 1.A.4]|uniref:hypothetical protein n=1 Tax=Sphingobacterium sp. 1.A.4 TaxID=2044603 RepID=UPI000C0BEB23|nr:hypothetical protein [Sphingobacterium sp. 1.A.4]